MAQKTNVRRTRRFAGACALTAALAVSGGLAGAIPAQAASGDSGYLGAGSNVRYGPGQQYAIAYTTNYGAWIPFECWVDNQYQGGWYRWFKIYGQSRWTWADNVSSQPSLPHC